ncbi:MAG: prolyl oligopeptidase family serine peptidase [Myxococcota bacterium]
MNVAWFTLSALAQDPAPEADPRAEAGNAETDAWMAESGRIGPLTDALTRLRIERQSGQNVVDHRAGATLWALREPDPANADQPDFRLWKSHTTLSLEREGTLVELPLPAGSDDTWRLCSSALSPDGSHALVARSDPPEDPTRPEKHHAVCHVALVDLESLGTVELGVFPRFSSAFGSDGTLWLTHRDRRHGPSTVERYDRAGASLGAVRRDRRWVRPVVVPGTEDADSLMWWSSPRTRRKRSRFRVRLDDGPWVRLPRGRWSWVGLVDGDLVLLTDRGGTPHRVVRIDPADPARQRWETLLTDTEIEPFRDVSLHGDTLLVTQAVDGVSRFTERPLVPDPAEPAAVSEPLGGPHQFVSVWRSLADPALVTTGGPEGLRSFTRALDGTYTELEAPNRTPVVFTSSLAISADGAKVPVSWAHAPGLEPTGDAPVWLRAYGGFGHSSNLWIGPVEILWLELGGIVGTVHARGGQERGAVWHDQATQENLGRTFEDVIAAAEWFVDEGWTRPGRLAISGASNGGLTAMACVAERPDLFGAGISQSGVHDLLGGKEMEGGWWGGEYGRPGNADQRAVMERYSPVARRPDPVPAVLLATGREDPTVPLEHSYRLKEAWGGLPGGPVLLRVYPWTSHAHHLPRKKRDAAWSEVLPVDRDRASAEELELLIRVFGLDWEPDREAP